MGVPYNYELLNEIYAQQSPTNIHVDSTLSRFFKRYLLETAISVFKWDVPKLWAKNYLLYCLYGFGFVAVIDTDKYGVIPQHCGLGGYNVFYQPAYALVTNPRLRLDKTRYDIGTECELLQLQPDYFGIMDLVSYYSDLMALCAQAAAVNITNSKLAYMFAADHKSAAETFKKAVDQVISGTPAVAVDKELFTEDGSPRWITFAQNLNDNYIADKINAELQKYQSDFMRAIGIPQVGQEKKERLITSEIDAGNSDCKNRAALWLESLKNGCEKINAMFGGKLDTKLDVNWRFDPTQEMEAIGNAGNDERLRNVSV